MCTRIPLSGGIISVLLVTFLCLALAHNQDLIRRNSYLAKIHYSPIKRGEKPLRCSGAIISTNWIVTSAKCALYSWRRQKGNRTHDYADVLVTEDTPLPTCKPLDASHYRYVIDVALPSGLEKTIHGKPDASLDIAMLKLNSPFQFSKNLKPIRIPKSPDHCEPNKAFFIGWGGSENLSVSEDHWSNGLRKIDLDMVNEKECTEQIPGLDDSTVVCARAAKNSKSEAEFTCHSDIGGPLVKMVELTLKQAPVSQKYPFLCGVLPNSACAGAELGKEHKIGFYTDILRYVSWIAQVLKQSLPPHDNTHKATQATNKLAQSISTTSSPVAPEESTMKLQLSVLAPDPWTLETAQGNPQPEHGIENKPEAEHIHKSQHQEGTTAAVSANVPTKWPKKATANDKGRKNHILYHALTVKTTMRKGSASKVIPWPKTNGKIVKLPESRAVIGSIKTTIKDLKSFISSKS